MVQLLAMGAVSKLPEDVQWSVRVLLPRKEDPALAAAKAAAQAADSGGTAAVPNLAAASLPALAAAGMLQFPQQQQQQQQQAPVPSLPLLAQVLLRRADAAPSTSSRFLICCANGNLEADVKEVAVSRLVVVGSGRLEECIESFMRRAEAE